MRRLSFLLLVFAVLLSACEFSLAGDITPPPDASLPQADLTAEPIQYPETSPDLDAGAAIYAESCAPCHGVGGLGDGPQASELPFAPAPIGDPQLAGQHSPAEWYQIVSTGNLERFMPPFAGLLDPQQRWDVLAHVYSLSLNQEDIDVGEALYAANETEIQTVLPDILALSQNLGISLQDIVSMVEPTVPSLSSAQLIALASYMQARFLGLDRTIQTTTSLEETQAAETETAGFTGRVVNGSGQDLSAGLQAHLFGYDHDQQVFTAVTSIGSNGRFEFEAVPLTPERIYFASVDYLGLSYFSEFITVEEDGTEFEIPITIYETTSDASQLAVETLQFVFELPEPGILRVVQRVEITNLGDRAVVPSSEGEPVLRFSLPRDASNLVFEDSTLGDRYLPVEGGFGDLRGVLPGVGTYQLLFAYELPYSRGLTFHAPIDLPTRTILALVPEGPVELRGEAFQQTGAQEISGISYVAHVAEGGFSPGEEVEIQLRGAHPLGGGGLAALAADDRLLIGLAALTVAVGAVYFWLRRLPGDAPRSAEQIIDEIIALDQRYERGEIKQATYDKRRAALKDRLRAAMGKKKR